MKQYQVCAQIIKLGPEQRVTPISNKSEDYSQKEFCMRSSKLP